MRVLRLTAIRTGEVREVVRFLSTFEEAFNHVSAFDLIVADAEKRYGGETDDWRPGPMAGRGTARRSLQTISKPAEVVLPQDRLRLHAVSLASPGYWSFVGALNPLEILRQFLADRHQRGQGLDPRNPVQAEQLRMENERVKTEVVALQLKTLRDVGIPEDRIRMVLSRHVVQPLTALEDFQDSGLVGGAEILEVSAEGPNDDETEDENVS